MAINKNHEFEDLDGIKCAIVEKNATQGRLDFLMRLLEHNGYTVVVQPSAPPKVAAPVQATAEANEEAVIPTGPPAPETFTVGVTDVMFNPTNAIFGRLLKTPDGQVVTLAYWQGMESIADDSIPYFEKKGKFS